MENTERLRIAIDGPAGAGKSTAAKRLARELSIDYIDTGAMYRAIALKLIREHVDYNDAEALKELLSETDVDFRDGHVLLDGEIVDKDIRTSAVSRMASDSSAVLAIREKLVALQRAMGETKGLVMDGRDIGSNVLPDAEYKFYLTASVHVRACRRSLEMIEKGETADLDSIEADITARDLQDSTRTHHPLTQAEDAIVVDSTNLNIGEVVEVMLGHIRSRR
ncbi:MAG: (d)CMP kinase [Eubacteriales bacterium]|jgi:cytidylate kinase|nr:(d)CMP kinase [Eubacteriales bacterium]NLV69742.1 (d)CMP kinase [Clostridiales bacterium]HPF18980.1 (d)CMP kinase [Bacillota bacterium]HRV33038.1 (d)CMP kinase [Anaerovoracaceae bacterium]MDD3537910.1 (d)CMP kinase [Eubacteriales bacterium]